MAEALVLRRLLMSKRPSPPFNPAVAAPGKRLCWTEAGYLGVVPGESRLDDEVWLLKGGKMPMVLRKVDEGTYELVGDSYIHGVMNGEKFEEGRCREVRIA
jgi:hypothetical protein